MELILMIVLIGPLLLGVPFGIISLMAGEVSMTRPRIGYNRRVKRVELVKQTSEPKAIESPRKPIPAAIQAEIDQTPEWWDSLFHNALLVSGAVMQFDPSYEPEYVQINSADGSMVIETHYPGPRWLDECLCHECLRGKSQQTLLPSGVRSLVKTTREEQIRKHFNVGPLTAKALASIERKGYLLADENYWPDPAPARQW